MRGERSPENHCRSAFPIIPNNVNIVGNSMLKAMHRPIVVFTICAADTLQITANAHRITVLVDWSFPTIFRSSRMLRRKFTRCVTKKLKKYPDIPYLGSRMNNITTSIAEVIMLLRTQIFCCPNPFVIASTIASQYSIGARMENRRKYCPASGVLYSVVHKFSADRKRIPPQKQP